MLVKLCRVLCLASMVVLAMPLASAGKTDDDLRVAQRLAFQKRFAEAEASYREILRHQPKSRAAALGLGQVLLWEQHYGDAAAVYRRLLRDAAGDVDARKGLATAEYWSGDFRSARRDYAAVLRARPGDAEARKAVADITAAMAPVLASDNDYVNDDQPLHRMRDSIAYTFFSDPLTKWTTTAGTYALNARDFGSASAPFVSIGGQTSLAHTNVGGSMRLFRFPDGRTKPLGGVSVSHGWRGSTIGVDVDQHELLYTASSLRSHASETTATLGWNRTSDAVTSAAAVQAIRYFDGNAGRAVDGYHLVRVANNERGSISVGAAA